eukprot:CFRG3047T1
METFKEGHIVWAKLPKFSWWPGRIASNEHLEEGYRPSNKKTTVFFFGDNSYKSIQWKNIKSFDCPDAARLCEIGSNESLLEKAICEARIARANDELSEVNLHTKMSTPESQTTRKPNLKRKHQGEENCTGKSNGRRKRSSSSMITSRKSGHEKWVSESKEKIFNTPSSNNVEEGSTPFMSDVDDDDILSSGVKPKREPEIETGSLVWIKFGRYPFWPGRVLKVDTNSRKEKKFSVQFFKHSEDKIFRVKKKTLQVFVSNEDKVRVMVNSSLVDLLSGRNAHLVNCFIDAVKWAQDDIRNRGYQKCKVLSRTPQNKSLSTSDAETEKSDYTIIDPKSDDDGDDDEKETDQYEASTLSKYPILKQYTVGLENSLSKVKECILSIHNDRLPCPRYEQFKRGFTKEERNINRLHSFGPFVREADRKTIIRSIAEWLDLHPSSERGDKFIYINDVLVPETVVRIVAEKECITIEEADVKYIQNDWISMDNPPIDVY